MPVVALAPVKVSRMAVVLRAVKVATPGVWPSLGSVPIEVVDWSEKSTLTPVTWSSGLGRSKSWIRFTSTGWSHVSRNHAPAFSPLEAHS